MDDLDRHRTPEPRIDAAKHLAHPAFAKFALDLIRTEASAGMHLDHRLDVERRQALILTREQGFDFATQFGIGPGEQSDTPVGGAFAGGMIQLFDLPQTIRGHG